MKRIIALALAVLMMAAIFAACGSEEEKSSGSSSSGSSDSGNKASDVDLSAVLDDINAQFELTGTLKKLESVDELDRYYMISADDVYQFAGERSGSSTDYTEIVIVEAKSDDAIDDIKTQLNSRLDSQISTAKSYTPEAVELLESCAVKSNGNFVYLVVNENADDINKLIEEAIK